MNIFDFKISYKFHFHINSSLAITDMRYPKNYTVTQKNKFEIIAEKSGNTLFFDLYGMERDAKTWMQVQYRTEDMDRPKMMYQRCPELKGYIALMAQFLPTFESLQTWQRHAIQPA